MNKKFIRETSKIEENYSRADTKAGREENTPILFKQFNKLIL